MRNVLLCRRGSVAFGTVMALVPLIGVVALGGEAGSWYVTRQHAQNAADAAALSGAFWLACKNSGSSLCEPNPAQDYVSRGKEFAAQNSFCNSGDLSYPGSTCPSSLAKNTSRSVQIDRGTYDVAANTWTGSASGSDVRAIVGQQQPGYLAALVGLSTVNISATAVARVGKPKDVCTLALARSPSNSSALTLAGSLSVTGNGCEMMSDDTVKYASTPSFTGSGWAIGAANGCVNSGNCDPGVPYNYSMPPATNPLQVLDTASFNSRTGNDKPATSITCPTSPPPPTGTNKCYSTAPNSTGAYGNLTVTTGDWVDFAPGTYFFYNAAIKINGGAVTCTTCTSWATTGLGVTLVLLGDSSISITGGTVSLSAPKTNTTSSALNGVLIDDQAPHKSNNAVTINGSGTVALGGAMYLPNVDVTWSGTTANTNTNCSEVIANSVTMSGGAYMSTQNCLPNTVPFTQVVILVH
ncbi:pilus assembly protein TadG-related protein [Bradyrhizobium sp. Ec3.3]|uniref:pilus assembly protein TadG-related protein n=1 Tax=Bradyrhizobium sp. Ec3.3 TaxID=189753 RepID=UPI0005595984|nr:pilus assembly protein TadG-related protein [Bradyrhizobium sp. Ec3.3]